MSSSFNLCTQITHYIRDAGSGRGFITPEIPRGCRIVTLGSLQSAGTFLIGKRRNEFSYSWNCGKRHLQILVWSIPQALG
jgi:hypothetical protein